MNISEISNWVRDARQRTIDFVADIPDDKLFSPKLDIINPWLWEIGHVGLVSGKVGSAPQAGPKTDNEQR